MILANFMVMFGLLAVLLRLMQDRSASIYFSSALGLVRLSTLNPNTLFKMVAAFFFSIAN